ncbi:MAG: hypothetical protein ABI353_20895, partial [Isosphaeraceae bacterium]
MGHCVLLEKRWLALTPIGLALMLAVAPKALAKPPEAARLVSADALIYAEVRHSGALIDRATDTSIHKLVAAIPGYEQALKSDKLRDARATLGDLA